MLKIAFEREFSITSGQLTFLKKHFIVRPTIRPRLFIEFDFVYSENMGNQRSFQRPSRSIGLLRERFSLQCTKQDSKNTVWKVSDFSVTQILREINFEASKTSKTILGALYFVYLLNFSFQKVQKFKRSKFKAFLMCQYHKF